ncbi:hypothetical protein [Microcoleus sp. FACHB-672]|uniref:hypothetical protein n=1 Tax=Microcoleus sp. FACHB-672 TaxID=2692825 RepID=UPI0016828E2E|nr:hypothetical protein [Microcoleus sp. FACHB-672]MBD2042856.1 hypothetical protein [Microcoleus sp. FACHB-672]
MWRQLKNFFVSVSAYTDLGPDLQFRRQVNAALRPRPALTLDEWFEFFWRTYGVSKPVVAFVYTHLEKYSGVKMSRVQPKDHLERDLQITLVCCFDWHLTLCDDFLSCFGVDISEEFEIYNLTTIEEFVEFLNAQVLAVQPA